jgi:hypothetical protein
MEIRAHWAGRACIVLAAFAGGFVAQLTVGGRDTHAQEAAHKQLRVRQLVLLDDGGRKRAVLAAEPEGVGLVIKDGSGRRLVTMGAIGAAGVEGAGLTVFGPEGEPRLLVGMLEQPVGWGLRAYDEAGQNRMTAGVWPGVISGMRVYDGSGVKRAGFGFGPQGGGIALMDPAGQERLGMGMDQGGGGDFVAKDRFGNDLWRALGEVGPPVLP